MPRIEGLTPWRPASTLGTFPPTLCRARAPSVVAIGGCWASDEQTVREPPLETEKITRVRTLRDPEMET